MRARARNTNAYPRQSHAMARSRGHTAGICRQNDTTRERKKCKSVQRHGMAECDRMRGLPVEYNGDVQSHAILAPYSTAPCTSASVSASLLVDANLPRHVVKCSVCQHGGALGCCRGPMPSSCNSRATQHLGRHLLHFDDGQHERVGLPDDTVRIMSLRVETCSCADTASGESGCGRGAAGSEALLRERSDREEQLYVRS
jgi:hypothetical protein